MSTSVLENARLGLGHLLEIEDAETKYWQHRATHEVDLGQHPFGLEVGIGPREVKLVANPLHTEPSVQGMLLCIQQTLRDYSPTNVSKFRLRIIRAETVKDFRDQNKYVHQVYFELTRRFESFICGGCNDCTGAGGYGRRRLESVFELVGLIHDIAVENIVVPRIEAQEGIALIHRQYAAFEKERSAA